MRVIDLDNLDVGAARRAIEKARAERPWCVRDRKDKSLYRVRARQRIRHGRVTQYHFVKFIFGPTFRYAACTCRGFRYNAEHGGICYAMARAYFKHLHNLKRDAVRATGKRVAA